MAPPASIRAYPVVERRLRKSLAYAASTKHVNSELSIGGKSSKQLGRDVGISEKSPAGRSLWKADEGQSQW